MPFEPLSKNLNRIPAKFRPWLLSLLGGSALLLSWGALDRLAGRSPAGAAAPGAAGSGQAAANYRDGVYRATSQAPWGPMTIEITVSGGRWTGIQTVEVPNSPPSRYAVTDLVQQALRAQSAVIDGVSGATYASDAFRDDLRQIVALSKK